jgi:hypothetical protein
VPLKNGWTERDYAIFRAVFGGFLFVHFVQLLPWGAEVFSNAGALPDGAASPLLSLFPNVLAVWDTPFFVGALLACGAASSLLLAAGRHDRIAAFVLWYILACLFGRNPLISNPSLPYVGLLLLAHASLPHASRKLSTARTATVDTNSTWSMKPSVYLVVWILMACGYSYSGYIKLDSPSWMDGTALVRVLENPLARISPLRDALLSLPAFLLRLATWGALLLELLFAPLVLWRRARPFVWGVMLLMHLALVVLVNFAELSAGMILLHLFTCDPRWFRRARTPRSTSHEMTRANHTRARA